MILFTLKIFRSSFALGLLCGCCCCCCVVRIREEEITITKNGAHTFWRALLKQPSNKRAERNHVCCVCWSRFFVVQVSNLSTLKLIFRVTWRSLARSFNMLILLHVARLLGVSCMCKNHHRASTPCYNLEKRNCFAIKSK